jgi:hypothetical protein
MKAKELREQFKSETGMISHQSPWAYAKWIEEQFVRETCNHDLRFKNSENGMEQYCIRNCGYTKIYNP